MLLGRKRNNPYALTNMRSAFGNLYTKSSIILDATHKYVKFLPSSQEHLVLLEDWETDTNVALFDFPLEYEILEAGEKYIDPAVSDSLYTYQYASVPVDISLPGVPNQVIEELFIPPYDSYLTEVAFYQVGEEYDGNTSPHPEWSYPTEEEDPNHPINKDNCTPACSNYPCCELGWEDCDESPCDFEEEPPCTPAHPDWPKCLAVFPPPPPPPPPTTEYCKCTEYTKIEDQYGNFDTEEEEFIVELLPGETCDDYEGFTETNETQVLISCTTFVPPPPPTLNGCGCPIPTNRRHPAGCVQVENDLFNHEAVQRVQVKVKDTWFTSDIAYTDDNGCWYVWDNHYGSVWMWVRFKNKNVKVRSIKHWLALRTVADYVDRFKSPPYNNITVQYGDGVTDNEGRARLYWACAHTMNTTNVYRNSAGADGIPLPRKGLNYLVRANDGASSAPMLQSTNFNLTFPFFDAIGIPLPTFLIQSVLPDVINQYGPGERARAFNGTAHHELGHASHYELVGESYWVPYRKHIIANFGYGSFGDFNSGSDPGRVALGEAIGFFMGNRYGFTARGGENSEWVENFIPAGLMFDLGDTNVDLVIDPNTGTSVTDNISGFTPGMIFGALNQNVNDIRVFRDRLRILSLSDTPNTAPAYNTFVDGYDVFN